MHLFEGIILKILVNAMSCTSMATIQFKTFPSPAMVLVPVYLFPPPALATIKRLPVSAELPFLGISYQWNQVLCGSFVSDSFHYGAHFLVFETDQDLSLMLYLVDKTVGNLTGSFTQTWWEGNLVARLQRGVWRI